MTRLELIAQIRAKKSFLIIGLDSDAAKIPRHLLAHPDAVLAFNRQIIDATSDLCVGYKINTAFYESRGVHGWDSLAQTLDYIPSGLFRIADAKRGDIGNTSLHYAKTFFEVYPFDAMTVSPFMGEDSVRPFLEYPGKWTILLGLTSNPGSRDFQMLRIEGEEVFARVIRQAAAWGTAENLMFVVGGTRSDQLEQVRRIVPGHFLLVPGIGYQGGDLGKIAGVGMTDSVGLLVNISRDIIYAGGGEDFALKARVAAQDFQQQMATYLP